MGEMLALHGHTPQKNRALAETAIPGCGSIDFQKLDELTTFKSICESSTCMTAFQTTFNTIAALSSEPITVPISETCDALNNCPADIFEEDGHEGHDHGRRDAEETLHCGDSSITQACYDALVALNAKLPASDQASASELAACQAKVTSSGKSDKPCFSRDAATACLITDAAIEPASAYAQCFGDAEPVGAKRVMMKTLQAGDAVLASEHKASRVIVGQHRAAGIASEMVHLVHDSGSLTLTPDHVLLLDNQFLPARLARPGSVLSNGQAVRRVERKVEGVINPLTTSGQILAADVIGQPVIASTYPEWVASYMLNSYVPLATLSNVLSFVLPETTQLFYDAVVEKVFPASAESYRQYLEDVPTAFIPFAFVFGDMTTVAAFALYSLYTNTAVVMVTCMVAAFARRFTKA